ncbi:hypothetical protein ACFE04_000822 [Oxalis oulophora]
MALCGGIHESKGGAENDIEIDSLARFAVDEHNKKENNMLQFSKVVKAQTQVVAGTMHHLTVEAVDGDKKKHYEAKVWVKPWMNFKELQHFQHSQSSGEWATVPKVQNISTYEKKPVVQPDPDTIIKLTEAMYFKTVKPYHNNESWMLFGLEKGGLKVRWRQTSTL